MSAISGVTQVFERWGKKALKLALLAPSSLLRIEGPGLFVLVYHRVGAGMAEEMDLPVDLFRRQMAFLKENFETVGLLDGLARLRGEGPRQDVVAVTFDDAYREVFTAAWPILRREEIPVTLFLSTGFMEGGPAPLREGAGAQGAVPEPLRWDEIEEMLESGLVEIGSHSHSHPDFDRISAERAEAELTRSNEVLISRLGSAAEVFAYPRAIVANEEVVVRHFRYAVAADGSKNTAFGFDPLRISRTPVRASDGMYFFRRRLDGILPLEDRAYELMRGRSR